MTSGKPRSEKFKRGLETRRAVLGSEYVDRSIEQADDFDWAMQQLTTEWCWDEIWNRPGIDRRSRSALNLGIIAALNRPQESVALGRSADHTEIYRHLAARSGAR